MRKIVLSILALVAAWTAPIEASSSHRLSLKENDLSFEVIQPESFVEEESNDLDLVFNDPNIEGRKCAFHFFEGADFDLSSAVDVCEYTDWVIDNAFALHKKTEFSITNSKEYAISSFILSSPNNEQTYCHVYVGKVSGQLVFSALAANPASFEIAAKDCDDFLNQIYSYQTSSE